MGCAHAGCVAMLGVLVFLVVYVWAVSPSGPTGCRDHCWSHLLFFAVAGIGWGVPLIPLLPLGEGRPKSDRANAEGPPGRPALLNSTDFLAEDGRSDRIRTCDPLTPSQVRYQAAPRSEQAAPL